MPICSKCIDTDITVGHRATPAVASSAKMSARSAEEVARRMEARKAMVAAVWSNVAERYTR